VMDAELQRWLDSGETFDYLGFDIFYRIEGSGPPLLLIHGYPFNSYDWAPIWPSSDGFIAGRSGCGYGHRVTWSATRRVTSWAGAHGSS
jgi:pimeloyl-ACP methyl ester carboxylesterase